MALLSGGSDAGRCGISYPSGRIARRTGLWRNTIRKVSAGGNGWSRRSVCRIDRASWTQASSWLKTEAGQVPQEAANAEAAPCGPGRPWAYEGSCNRGRGVRAEMERPIARGREQKRRPRHLHTAGSFQRWGGLPVSTGARTGRRSPGRTTKLQIGPYQSCPHSRAFLLRGVSAADARDCCSNAHWHAFRVFGGVPRAGGKYDNMKTAVGPGRSEARPGRSTRGSWR